MPRIARIVAPGYPHHIVQRGNNKQDVFFDHEDRRTYLRLLSEYTQECNCKTHAYCLMNNHIHLLVTPAEHESLSKMMQKLSLRYTQLINKKYNRTGRLWECRYHSCIVDKDSYLWTVCRYIETNPVRARIVSVAEDFSWSSARFNILGKKNDLLDKIWQSEKERLEYKQFTTILEDEINREIRKKTYSGKPLGGKNFLKSMEKLLGVNFSSRKKPGRPKKK